jgi:hypothetical protein
MGVQKSRKSLKYTKYSLSRKPDKKQLQQINKWYNNNYFNNKQLEQRLFYLWKRENNKHLFF